MNLGTGFGIYIPFFIYFAIFALSLLSIFWKPQLG
jgi:hypothetical protein